MNLSKEDKKKYCLNVSNNSTEVNKINEKLIKNKNERRNKLNKKDKMLSINPKLHLSHNKYDQDNIIDKIKNMINNSLITFLNNIIHSIYQKKQIEQIFLEGNISNKITMEKLIRDINYSFIKNKKKGIEILSLLNMSIKDYLCHDISKKYAGIPKNYNEIIIKVILSDKENEVIFQFIFNYLKIEDWLNIFIYQKKISNFLGYNSLNENKKQIIKKSLVRINQYFNKIYKNKDNKGDIYFHCFMIMIYNFRRLMMIKEQRNTYHKKDITKQ